jgi:hypothetical protein
VANLTKLSKHIAHIILLAVSIMALTPSCKTTRRVPEGAYLLDKNTIIIEDRNSETIVSTSNLEDILKQKPNRRIFKVKFHLMVHNLPNPQRVERKAEKRKASLDERNIRRAEQDSLRNVKRVEKGKTTKPQRAPIEYTPVFGEWIRYTVGEPPVILDSSKTTQSRDQMRVYLVKKGYFNSSVTDSVVFHKRKPKAHVYYRVNTFDPYRVRNFAWNIPDRRIERIVESHLGENPILRQGEIFDTEKLSALRDDLTASFINRGYYGFVKDYIFFRIDSALNSRQVDITLGISNPRIRLIEDDKEILVEANHTVYSINNIFVFTDYDSQNRGDIPYYYDTLHYNELVFAYIDHLMIKPDVLQSTIYLERGHRFNAKLVEDTRKQLGALGVFRTINIRFKPASDAPDNDQLDVYIILIPNKSQFAQIDADGTHTGGNYGLQGSFNYSHRNLFRGAERFKFRIGGALEVQQLLVSQDVPQSSGTFKRINPFNTLEIGPELSLEIPKLIFIKRRWVRKWIDQSTAIKGLFNYQQRPDFIRGLQDFQLVLTGRPNLFVTHQLRLLEISALEIDPSPEFQARLDQINDAVIRAAYQNHIISGLHYSYVYNDQILKRQKTNFYYRGTFKSAGNTLRMLYQLSGAEPDSLNSYRIFGIRFAQFVRTSHEIRYYQNYNEKSKMVYRFFGGIGVPLTNLKEAIPFEESFFTGGSTGIRGWRARALGPGGYLDTTFVRAFDKIGDIQIEANIEYRFDLLKVIEGAIFADAGNIWMLRPSNRENAHISKDLYKQIALNAGIGLRIDLEFFIIRLDVALQLHDPALPDRERWIFQGKEQINEIRRRADELNPNLKINDYRPGINLNFAIGYPF